MIDVKKAIAAAKAWMVGVYDPKEIPELMLEEVRKSSDGRDWLITMGYQSPGWKKMHRDDLLFGSGIGANRFERTPREYKELHVDGLTGQVNEMVLRKI